jgi:hypothetical protein
VNESETAGPLRCARDDKVEGDAHLGLGEGGRTEPTQRQPTRFRLPALSSTHSASYAVQKAVSPLICTALITNPIGK